MEEQPPDPRTWRFTEPKKHIEELHRDLSLFRKSPAGTEIVAFIREINRRVRGTSVSQCRNAGISRGSMKFLELLALMKKWIAEIPPEKQEQRFGNRSFRTWLMRCEAEIPGLLVEFVFQGKEEFKPALVEILPYFMASFGDKTRIDYGTGHELNFVAFLYCLVKVGIFGEQHFLELALVVFNAYLDLMRELQTIYWLEPAGSRGVWGLDDYQFIPFIWGSSQLIDNGIYGPESIHDEENISSLFPDYLYFDAIRFIKSVKTGLFQEYAPILNDISGCPNWSKVNTGLLRMYDAEVLGKFPVVQHFLFGSLLPFQSQNN